MKRTLKTCPSCGGQKGKSSARCFRCRRAEELDWIPRFWSRIDRSGGPDACWPWTYHHTLRGGYGAFSKPGDRVRGAHRIAWELLRGLVPEGLVLDHLVCSNPPCCNPAHLNPTTNLENLWRGRRVNVGPDERCRRGHVMDGANLTVRPDGGPKCRACHAEYNREFRQRRRASNAA